MKRKIIYSALFVIGLALVASAGRVNNSGKNGCCCIKAIDRNPVKIVEDVKEFSINPVTLLFS